MRDFQIHLVRPNAKTSNGEQPRCMLKDSRSQMSCRTDADEMSVGDRRE